METIKRPSRRMRLAVGHRSACGRRLSLRLIGPTLALSVCHDQRLCSCGTRLEALCKCYMPLLCMPLPSSDKRMHIVPRRRRGGGRPWIMTLWTNNAAQWKRQMQRQRSVFLSTQGPIRLACSRVHTCHSDCRELLESSWTNRFDDRFSTASNTNEKSSTVKH